MTHKIPFTGYEGKHVVDQQLSLLRLIGFEPKPVSGRLPLQLSAGARDKAAQLLAAQGLTPQESFFVVVPGGGRSWGRNAVYKQWAPERFSAVADDWAASSGERIVLVGDGDEKPILEEVQRYLNRPSVLLAGESLESVCALLMRAQWVLCNDGGLLHLSNALGIKTVSVYGPVDETAYGPYGNLTPHEVLTEPVPCRPCYKNFHFPPCDHQRRCQEELPVEKVLAAVKKIS